MLTEEQTQQIKEQLVKQISENFPEDKRDFAIEQVNSMNSEELENFLKQNQMSGNNEEKCVFCSIISGEIPSYKIGENEKAIAVLEINPISQSHALIIPKEHKGKIDEKEIKELSAEIAKKIKTKFKAKKIELFPSELFNHKVLNILPIYKDETSSSKRKKEVPEELKEIQEILIEEPKEKKPKKEHKEEKKTEVKEPVEKLRLPKRIP
ncbi:MAG: HIT domain-containing protein [Nanoarchaeota archaeon]|nr:HIT domain-containing protein [Nanoarchaeota archaeon]